MEWLKYQQLPSTSLLASQLVRNHALPFGVWTYHQTGGLGQRGKTWESHAGDVTFTLAIPKPSEIVSPWISLQVGSFVALWLRRHENHNLMLKWPNDLLYRGKKEGGILCQVVGEALLLGVGLNLKAQHKTQERSSWEERGKKLPCSWELSQNLGNFLVHRDYGNFQQDLYQALAIPQNQLWRQGLGAWRLGGKVDSLGAFYLGETRLITSSPSLRWYYQEHNWPVEWGDYPKSSNRMPIVHPLGEPLWDRL